MTQRTEETRAAGTSRLQVSSLAIGHRTVLHDNLSFDVSGGQILGVLGPSGCGKSTLLATIAGLIPALGGRVLVDGADVTDAPAHVRRCPMVFQEPLLFTHLDVLANVAYGMRRRGHPRAAANARAAELLDWADLSGLAHQRVDRLSGGQAQRVSLIRAIAAGPAVLLLDEPFSALDAPLRLRLAEEIRGMVAAHDIAAVHVTHDQAEAERLCSAILELRQPA